MTMIGNRAPLGRLKTGLFRIQRALGMRHWFPHAPLALFLGFGGIWLLRMDMGGSWHHYAAQILAGRLDMPPRLLPPILTGGGLVLIAIGLLWRSRIAWAMALLLLITGASSAWVAAGAIGPLLTYFILLTAALVVAWRHFDRSSVTAGTLFALTSIVMVLTYAVFGSYYLGSGFKPHITDLVTALYFSIITMSTVGYGDITPQTGETKLFVVSVTVLGIAIFATSLTAVIAPLLSNSLRKIVGNKGRKMKREDHFVIIGNTPLAVNVWRELAKRGRAVTRILRIRPSEGDLEGADVVVGDPSNAKILRDAGAHHAQAVLAMLDDDAENAFVILAVKELGGPARSICAINNAAYEERIKLVQPDMTIAPQILGGELLAMMLSGEPVTSDYVMRRVFHDHRAAAEPAGGDSRGPGPSR
jgi:voltage-gated potassium channel